MIPLLFGKQEVGIWRVKKRFPRYGVPIWSLWPNIRFLPSIVAEKNTTKNGPVLYENIIHKSITDNFSLNKVLFCNLCCRNAYSYLFSDGRGTISYYVHIWLSYFCVKRRGNFVKLLYLPFTNPHDWGIRLCRVKLLL